MVTITWQHSKMDTEGRGIARTLQCICEEGCDLRCPYAVLERLVNNATLKGSKDGHLAFSEGGNRSHQIRNCGRLEKALRQSSVWPLHETVRSTPIHPEGLGCQPSRISRALEEQRDLGVRPRGLGILGSQRFQSLQREPHRSESGDEGAFTGLHASIGQAVRRQGGQGTRQPSPDRAGCLAARFRRSKFRSIRSHKEHGGQDGHIHKVPATTSPISEAPGGSQEQQNIGHLQLGRQRADGIITWPTTSSPKGTHL